MALGIQNAEGPITVKMSHTCLAPSVVRRQNDLSVGSGLEFVSCVPQFLPEFYVVVNLAVVDDPQVIAVPHRLVAGWGEIQDGQSAMPQIQVSPASEVL